MKSILFASAAVMSVSIISTKPVIAGIFECYADVHDGCYVDTNIPCTDDEYQEFLGDCDWLFNNESTWNPSASAPVAPAPLGYTVPRRSAAEIARFSNYIRRVHGPEQSRRISARDNDGNRAFSRSDSRSDDRSEGNSKR